MLGKAQEALTKILPQLPSPDPNKTVIEGKAMTLDTVPLACPRCRGRGQIVGPVGSSESQWGLQACPESDCAAGKKARFALQQQRVREVFRRSSIPPRYESAELTDWPAAVGEILFEVSSGNTSLFVMGKVGRGKSHLASALLRAKLEQGIAGLFVEVPELLARLRACYDNPEDKFETVVETVRDIDVLVLDDVGAEKATDWAREQLYRVINHRYNHCLQTIATTNVSNKALTERVGERIVSRLQGLGLTYSLPGPDRRINVVDQCKAAGVPVFVKNNVGWRDNLNFPSPPPQKFPHMEVPACSAAH